MIPKRRPTSTVHDDWFCSQKVPFHFNAAITGCQFGTPVTKSIMAGARTPRSGQCVVTTAQGQQLGSTKP